jgi:hypothetical protein
MVWINAATSGRLNEPAQFARAVQWQRQTQGRVYVSVPGERGFKFSLPEEIAREIEIAVLGSSTVMPISSDILHKPMYNFSLSGSSLGSSIRLARYLIERYQNIKIIMVGYDWALTFPFTPPDVQLALPDVPAPPKTDAQFMTTVSGLQQSLSSTQALFTASQFRISFRNDAGLSFVGQLFGKAVVETRCQTGERLAYFGAFRPGCPGFFPDGSIRFETYLMPFDPNTDPALLVQQALNIPRYYGNALRLTNGEPNKDYLEHLAQLSTSLKARGGRLVLVLPPLIPGFERALASGSDGASLRKLKSALSTWAQANNSDLIDGGRAEDEGCHPGEFIDAHHAITSCYSKVLTTARRHLDYLN